MYSVYWIRLEKHTNSYTEGYIGITCNLKERLRAHKKNRKTTHFFYAINKYGWNNLIVEVLHDSLTVQEALSIEELLRPSQSIGWNSQKGGELGVESSWYNIDSNRQKHRRATSEATKNGISLKDSTEKRALRAKQNWISNKDSYKDMSKGSNNPRAILNEEQVKKIKYSLIPLGLTNLEIALLFSVKPYVISFIRIGKNWKHI